MEKLDLKQCGPPKTCDIVFFTEGPTNSEIRCANVLKPDLKSLKSSLKSLQYVKYDEKISEIRLENLEIRCKIPGTLTSDVKYFEYGLKPFKSHLKSL